jgi:hypothetical protein
MPVAAKIIGDADLSSNRQTIGDGGAQSFRPDHAFQAAGLPKGPRPCAASRILGNFRIVSLSINGLPLSDRPMF